MSASPDRRSDSREQHPYRRPGTAPPPENRRPAGGLSSIPRRREKPMTANAGNCGGGPRWKTEPDSPERGHCKASQPLRLLPDASFPVTANAGKCAFVPTRESHSDRGPRNQPPLDGAVGKALIPDRGIQTRVEERAFALGKPDPRWGSEIHKRFAKPKIDSWSAFSTARCQGGVKTTLPGGVPSPQPRGTRV